jgi:cytoskeletal protein RodZ
MAMQTSTAYFAGAGTVVIAVVIGLGGGVLIANVMNPKTTGQQMAKLERRTAATPQPATNPQPAPKVQSASTAQSAQPSSAPTSSYLAATQAAAISPIVVAPATAKAADQPQQPTEQQPAVQPSPSSTTAASASTAPPSKEPAQHDAKAPEQAFAKARDSDLKTAEGDSKMKDADVRHRVARHRAEHRQQWAERRHYGRSRDADLRDVEQAVREDSPREYIAEPVEMDDAPRVRLFDGD